MKKILVVDDQPDIFPLLSLVLGERDRTFIAARDGASAVEIARQETPDLILMDHLMPGAIDGMEAVRRLRAGPSPLGCPILLMSAVIGDHPEERARSCGADAFLEKPFVIQRVKETVDRLLP